MITPKRSGTPDSPANDGTIENTLSSAIENSSVGNASIMSIVRGDQRVAPAAGVARDEAQRDAEHQRQQRRQRSR